MLSIEDKKDIINELKQELNNEVIDIELVSDIELPKYSNLGDAGMDVRSTIDTVIKPGETIIIPLGFKLNIPISYEIQIRPRSGLSLKTPLRISNSPGTVDSGYKDEIGVIITNTSTTNTGEYELTSKGNKQGSYIIHKGDRIAQMVLSKYVTIKLNKVDKIDVNNNRGGGFGHSGI